MSIKVTDSPSGDDEPLNLQDFLAKLEVREEERDGWLCRCPAHDDAKASLRVTVSEETGKVLLKCRAGCSNTKVMKALGLSIKDLAAMKADPEAAEHTTSSNDALPEESAIAELGDQLNTWALDLDTPLGAEALAYAAQRFGLEPEDARRLGLGVTTSLGGGPRLVVPFRDMSGRPRGFQARALNNIAQVRWAGPANPEKASWTRIGFFPGTSGWEEVIITEGPGDALTAVSTGYDALAIRGAGLVENEATLDRVAEMLQGRVAIVAGDGDSAGKQFSAKLAEALIARGVTSKIMKMRDGLDLSDWRAEDPAWFRQGFVKEVAKLSTVTAKQAKMRRWSYPFADIGGAQYLKDKLANEGRPLRYTDAAGFFQLENGAWVKKAEGDVRTYAQAVGKDLNDLAIAAKDDNPEFAANAWEYRKTALTSRGIDAILKELKSLPGIRAELADFDRHPHLLAVRNGVVDLKTGNLLPHDPSLLLTRRIDLDYRKAVPAPRWNQFLTEVFPDQPDMPGYMQRVVGYGITGETDEQVFIVNYGTGANGKSIWSDVITTIFDPITTITPFSTFEARRGDGVPNDLAALAGARLVIAPEGNQGKLMDEALLKRVTGQDKITARFLRREFFEYRPQFLLLMATNYKPAFRGQDEGLWRRVKLIEWRRYFKPEERDHGLQDKLMAEAEGILSWAIAGAVAWYAGGLQEPASITAVTDDFRKQSDSLVEFLSMTDESEYTKGDVANPDHWIARTDLFRDFQDWADRENFLDLKNWSSRAFYRAIEERGYPAGRRNGVIGFRGIRKSQPNPFDAPTHIEVDNGPAEPAPAELRGPNLEDGIW
ncbi:DNA primase/helicase [Microbacterium phage Didgeridoo]|uniref:DNA primase/helicase n=1 Tax=Microbacterium phage Didgeridoo TaxID=2126928 RepID=UPI000D203EDD|nr:DNA primase/helicase [Microbacterium phage Didgeridoo]AVR56709.1 DNA primase/helicase [Microbacterium phage Didgeridoo]